jgi:hypothetical protein
MQSFTVLDERPTLEILVLNGEHLTGSVNSVCDIVASNEYGPFETNISNIERVVSAVKNLTSKGPNRGPPHRPLNILSFNFERELFDEFLNIRLKRINRERLFESLQGAFL